MRFMKIALPVLALSALLAGCKEEAKSVDWYKANRSELAKVYQECTASGDDSDNCKNAKQAHYDIQQKDAPITQFH